MINHLLLYLDAMIS